MKPNVFSTYGQTFNFDLNQNCEIFIDVLPKNTKPKDIDIRIFIAMEPDQISNLSNEIIRRKNEFDYIFTFDEKILNNCENSVLFEFGTTWIGTERYTFPEKKFSISMVCGHKETTKNHLLRKKIWYRQNEIKNPIDFYLSKFGGVENKNNNAVLGELKDPMFNSMFHICIENVSQKYYFSEKLIDCFLCKTVPVYVGCQNVENYFDIKGMVIANNYNELVSVCNSLTKEDYVSRTNSIENNYINALKWIDYEKRLEEKIKYLKTNKNVLFSA